MLRSNHHGRDIKRSHKAEMTTMPINTRRLLLRAPAALGSTERLAKAASAIVRRRTHEAAACDFAGSGTRYGSLQRNDYAFRSVVLRKHGGQRNVTCCSHKQLARRVSDLRSIQLYSRSSSSRELIS